MNLTIVFPKEIDIIMPKGGKFNKRAYRKYLRSPQWQSKRQKALKRAGYRCQVCNASNRLEVHHRTYERVGKEYLKDLTVLCRSCHGTFHQHRNLSRI